MFTVWKKPKCLAIGHISYEAFKKHEVELIWNTEMENGTWDLSKQTELVTLWIIPFSTLKKYLCIYIYKFWFVYNVGIEKYWIVQFTCWVESDSLWPHQLQHARLPCPSPIPGVYSNTCPLSRWCHPTISSSVVPFSPHLPSFPASGSFPVSQFFAWGGQSIGVSASASVLPMNIQDWFPLGWTGWISL